MIIAAIALTFAPLYGPHDQWFPEVAGVPPNLRIIRVSEYYPRTSDQINNSNGAKIEDVANQHILAIKFKAVTMGTGQTMRIYTPHPGEVPYDQPATVVPKLPGSPVDKYGWRIDMGAVGDLRTIYLFIPSRNAPPTTLDLVFLSVTEVWDNSDPNPFLWHFDYDYVPYVLSLDVTKIYATDAAIDTRRAYGQPNEAGQIIADPNTELRNINFGSWFWSGGLFAGHMPESFKDRSGFSRVQFWPDVSGVQQGTLDARVFSTLTTLDLGGPITGYESGGGGGGTTGGGGVGGGGGFEGGGGTTGDETPVTAQIPTLGVYAPDPLDPNLIYVESDVTWGTRWDIDPVGVGTGSGGTAHEAWSTVGPIEYDPWNGTSETGGDYINWPATLVDENPVAAWGDAYDTVDITNGLLLAMVDEATFDGDNTIYWRYFGSREYEALFPTVFPRNDGQPRVWMLSGAAPHLWRPTYAPGGGGGGGGPPPPN